MISSPLIDTERALAVLLGQAVLESVRSSPVTEAEANNAQWLKASCFAGGLRSLPTLNVYDDEKEDTRSITATTTGETLMSH